MGRITRAAFIVGLLVAVGAVSVIAAVPQSAPLKIMSFNIRYGTAEDGDNAWELRRGAVIETIEGFRPDVLGVQEALRFQLDELAGAVPRYQRIGVGRSDGAEGGEYAAILVDGSRLEVLEQGTFWFSDTPEAPGSTSWGNEIPRICTWARLRDRASGRSLYVYNVHWDHVSQPSRERSADLLLQRIAGRAGQEDPVVVTGDFNAGESNPAFTRLLGFPQVPLVDTFRTLNAGVAEVGTFNGFAGTASGDKIDAVLASNGVQVLAAEIDRAPRQGRYPSDHFPVTSTIALGPVAGPSPGAPTNPEPAPAEPAQPTPVDPGAPLPPIAEVRTMFQSGRDAEVIQAAGLVAGGGDAAGAQLLFMAGLSHQRLNQDAQAREIYGRLAGRPEGDPWRLVGASALAVAERRFDEALGAATQAAAMAPQLPQAQYQLGIARGHKQDFANAATAFVQATMLDPDYAYAHLNAGLSYQRVNRIDLLARHFEAFLRLAPQAPERPMVESIMRTIRGRGGHD